MKETLQGHFSVLLGLLCGFVLGEADYLLLKQTHHVAFSKDPVYVDFYLSKNNTITARNVSIILLDLYNNQIVTSKTIASNETQGSLEFECFYFISAGIYQFQMTHEEENHSSINNWNGSTLNVTWPVFHFALNRTSKDLLRSFQIGVFTNTQLCSEFPGWEPPVVLEVEHIPNLQEMGTGVLYKTLKQIPLSTSQWVELECASDRPETFITLSLKATPLDLIMAFVGPVNLVQLFNYKLITPQEDKCDTLVNVNIIPPPCNYAQGKVVVYSEIQRSLGIMSIAENVLEKGDNAAHFNCTLFDIGRNKYCFEFLMHSNNNHSLPRVKECMEIRREIEAWSLWQAWSPCSTTCGEGQRERHRECLSTSSIKPSCNGNPKEISLCSLEDCSTVKPSSKSTAQSENDYITSNTVTITGILLCLFIIIVTILITVWRKVNKTQKCSSSIRHSSAHSVNCRKNSDEENICQLRESFSDAGDCGLERTDDIVQIPLTCRQSVHVGEEQEVLENDNVQKLIPPIFSYRLAQQQLKEMKQKGLTEATKVYHVSPNPMADTTVDVSLVPPLGTEKSEETATNKFRIQSPFLESKHFHSRNPGDKNISKAAYSAMQGTSPSQTMPRLSHIRNQDAKERHTEKSNQKNNFRRTSSFHETKHHKPYRERSLSTLSPRQTLSYNTRTKSWDNSAGEKSKHKLKSPERVSRGANLTVDTPGYNTKHPYIRPMDSKPDVSSSRFLAARSSNAERPEQNKMKKGHSPVDKPWNRAQDISPPTLESYQRKGALSPTQYRREKCQSFPWGTEFNFYDNTTFGLTEAEQRMIDLPGYFASNEEDETSTLSVERLVI
ncbi:thrombospondin type-1 domain-containing protein 1 [Bombina bombina]|uniref:thrombospondin type-1 domain-containing protein 1 n=1 Tax=Bombina bombina TaxID=8345 RepID=UPI00235AAD1F|nr:thrombospondin type-1 domain-containing protein 1 [Bombina bombina]